MTKFPDFTDDYRSLNQSIHAPSHLQASVLEAVHEKGSTKPRRSGRYSRGFSLLQKAAVAALIALLIPVTAYAAVKATSGIREWVAHWGVKDMDAVETLVNTFPSLPEETISTPEGYAEYTVLEAICDSQSMFITAEIKPLTDKYFFYDIARNETMGSMVMEGYDGDPEMLISDYAASIGKELMFVSIYLYDENGNSLPVGKFSTCKADGTIVETFSGNNPYDAKTFPVTVECFYSTPDDSVSGRFEYEIQMSDNSTRTPVKTFTQFEITDLNVQMKEMVIEKTELGYVVTSTYAAPSTEFYYVSLMDADGNYLNPLPGSTMPEDNGDGTYTVVDSYTDIPSLDALQFKLVGGSRESGEIEKYGPYQILG